ncbi:type II secretion system F family protein [Nocardioides sp.]|uniref:type II secretion system F family protein n=1 Tax=Nocardioides sp. TaxID=35761 RepID=UPI0035141DD4
MSLLAALLLGAAMLLSGPAPRPLGSAGRGAPDHGSAEEIEAGLLRRWRWAWAVLAGVGAGLVLGGALALPVGVAVAALVARAAGRLEPAGVRAQREAARRDLPSLVTLLAAALRAGASPLEAVELVCRALPGPATRRLDSLALRLRLGADPAVVWAELAQDDALAPLGRTLARAHRSGAPVVTAIERLGIDLARRARAEVEDRARTVGVRAAVPLGVCLLPAFVLLGIVPLAVSLAAGLAL